MALLSIDNLAARYHCLPSEVLVKATTFDLHILDLSTRYQNKLHAEANSESSVTPPTEDEMLAMLKRVREET
jgi:hypothetical protein